MIANLTGRFVTDLKVLDCLGFEFDANCPELMVADLPLSDVGSGYHRAVIVAAVDECSDSVVVRYSEEMAQRIVRDGMYRTFSGEVVDDGRHGVARIDVSGNYGDGVEKVAYIACNRDEAGHWREELAKGRLLATPSVGQRDGFDEC